MIKYLRPWLVYSLVLCIPYSVFSQTTAPKYSNEFLSIGVGAKALAMSGAQAATVNDVTAGYWNPAGIVGIKNNQVPSLALMHAEYFAGIAKYDYAAYSRHIDSSSALGISLIRFGVDDIPDTRQLFDENGNLDYNRVQFFSAADYALFLSFAKILPKFTNLRLGGSAKIVHRSVGQFGNSWGFGLDAGAQYNKGDWAFGLMLRDVTSTFNAWTFNTDLLEDVYLQTGNTLPESSLEVTLPKMILGMSRSLQIGSKLGALVALDLVSTFDGRRNTLLQTDLLSVDPAVGVEIGYEQKAWLRLGAGQFQQINEFDRSVSRTFQPSAGVGAKLGNVVIDYAFVDVGNIAEAPSSHVFSLKIDFVKK